MSDPTGSRASNPASGAAPTGFDMLEKMWSMMRLPAFPGMPAGAAAAPLHPSLAMMSDMISPLTNVEELDKRITDMRAVEQWLQLNLNMLQSAIQALEVQRATLATLRAFGAFAQTSMEAVADPAPASPGPAAAAPAEATTRPPAGPAAAAPGSASTAGTPAMGMDPAAWWNALQTQFNQIAGLAMATASANPGGPAQPRTGAAAPPKPAAGAPKRARKSAPRKAPKTTGKT